MRILFALLAAPFSPKNGQQVRNLSILRALAAEGHDVTATCFVEEERAEGVRSGEHYPVEGLCSLEFVSLPRVAFSGSQYISRLKKLVSPLPFGWWNFKSEEMTRAIARTLEADKIDAIICDGIYQIQNMPRPCPVPVLLNKDDVTTEIMRRYLRYERNAAKLTYGGLEYLKVRNWEAQALSLASGVLANSERERELLAALSPAARFAVVPNALDLERYEPAGDDDGKTVLFVGAMDWFPNQDAVEFFATKVLPGLRRRAPHARMVAAGRNPSEKLRRSLAGLGIEFTGTVPDVRPLIAQAAVCIAPLRIGSGTRIKILEAAAMGKSIVSTSLGAEGLALVNGEEILLADEPDSFAAGVAGLLADSGRRRAIGAAARKRVEADYSLPVLRTALRNAIADLVEGRRRVAYPDEELQIPNALSGLRAHP